MRISLFGLSLPEPNGLNSAGIHPFHRPTNPAREWPLGPTLTRTLMHQHAYVAPHWTPPVGHNALSLRVPWPTCPLTKHTNKNCLSLFVPQIHLDSLSVLPIVLFPPACRRGNPWHGTEFFAAINTPSLSSFFIPIPPKLSNIVSTFSFVCSLEPSVIFSFPWLA